MKKQDKLMFIVMIVIVAAIIIWGYVIMTTIGPKADYCREHPNTTLYDLESGAEENCTDYLPSGIV